MCYSDSGVSGFPSLNDPSIEVELTVREVKDDDGIVDLMCVTDDGRESAVYLQVTRIFHFFEAILAHN